MHRLGRGYRQRQDDQWEHTRFLGSLLINVNVKPEDQVTPQELVPLARDVQPETAPPLTPEQEREHQSLLDTLDADLVG